MHYSCCYGKRTQEGATLLTEVIDWLPRENVSGTDVDGTWESGVSPCTTEGGHRASEFSFWSESEFSQSTRLFISKFYPSASQDKLGFAALMNPTVPAFKAIYFSVCHNPCRSLEF